MILIYDEREERHGLDSRRSSAEMLFATDSLNYILSDTPYPVGISYSPLVDYATSIQNNWKYIGYREDIYAWLLTVSYPLILFSFRIPLPCVVLVALFIELQIILTEFYRL